MPMVSVIVPTRNSIRTIESCLKSIRKQAFKKLEIIVVDNYSSDLTLEIAKKFADKLFQKGPERSAQRNFGVKKSSGKFVIWIDADNILPPEIIKECLQAIENNLHALIIPEISVGKGFWAKCKILEKRCYLGDERIEAIRFIEKSVYNKVGRISENLISGEDWDITTRVRESGYKIGRIKTFMLHDEGQLKLTDDLRKKYYYATKSLPYVSRHIKGPKDVILFIFRPAYFRNWEILLADPLHTLGFLFMKLCEFGIGLIGFIRAKFRP